MNQVAQAVAEGLLHLEVDGALKKGDAAVTALLAQRRRYPGEAFLAGAGGIAGLEANFPQSAPEVLRRIAARYGAPAVARLRAADARVLSAVRAAGVVREGLRKEKDRPGNRPHPVLRARLDRLIDAHELTYGHVLGAMALGETGYPAGDPTDFDPPPTALAALGEMLWDDAFSSPPERVAGLIQEAGLEQQLVDSLVDAGGQFVGHVLAHHAGGDDITAAAILPPLAGFESRDLAVAQARLAGVATAVVSLPSATPATYFVCRLSDDLAYGDVVLVQGGPGTSIDDLHVQDDVIALTTAEGLVLRTDSDGRYLVTAQLPDRERTLPIDDPGTALEADAQLVSVQASSPDPRTADLVQPDPPLSGLFRQAVLDYTLVCLARSERRLRDQRLRFAPPPGEGAALKAGTAALASAMYEAAHLAWSMPDDCVPTENESSDAQRWTAKIGSTLDSEPLAALFVRSTAAEGAEPQRNQFTDELAAGLDGDAAIAAVAAIDARLDNIEALRRHLCADASAAQHLAVLHQSVLELFTSDQRTMLSVLAVLDGARSIATALGIGLRDLVLLVLAFVEGPVGLIAVGISAGFGLKQVGDGFAEAELLAVMAQLDVPGGFQLATADDASSARRWAWIGYALVFLDVYDVGTRTARMLRRATSGVAAASPLAGAVSAGPALRIRAAAVSVSAPAEGLSRLESAADLANRERLSTQAFRELSGELRTSQRGLRTLLISAVDEVKRAASVTALRQAAARLLDGGSARAAELGAVLRPSRTPPAAPAFRGTREYLVVGNADAEIGWGVEQLAAGRRTTALAPARNAAVDTFVGHQGTFVQGALDSLPAGYQCNVARETLLSAVVADVESFVTQRIDRLRQGGQWVLVTESSSLAEGLAAAAPRPGARIWRTEYTTFRNGQAVTRHVVVLARPRPTTMTALTSILRPPGLTTARVQAYLQTLRADLPRLQRKLAHVWNQGLVEAGEVAEGLLKNLTGNIAEILADDYKAGVLALRKAEAGGADSVLATGVRRIDGATGQSKEFTDDLIGLERNGNFQVSDVFEVKAGAKGGQEAQSQLFEWMENELEVGDRIVVNGRQYTYQPGGTGPGLIVGLGSARRHIVVAKGAEAAGRLSADQVAAQVVRATIDVSAAEIRFLAREVIEGLPPVQ